MPDAETLKPTAPAVPADVPPLRHKMREACAQHLARGLSMRAAINAAGYKQYKTKLAQAMMAPEVVARVETIRRQLAGGGSRNIAPLIDLLLTYATLSSNLGTAAGMREARGMVVEAARLKALLPEEPDDDPNASEDWAATPYNREQWLAEFAPQP